MTYKERVKEGQLGKFKGLKNGLNRINKYLFGWQRGCYTLLGGLSGAAKTTLADYTLIQALKDARDQGITVNVFYYCLEIAEESKRANWHSVIIYQKYKKVVEPEKIKGFGDFRLTSEELQMVENTFDELEELWGMINWIFETTNPTGVYKTIWRFMEKRGTFQYEEYLDEHNNKKERIVRFIPNDSNEYNILIGDHVGLFALERGYNLKENIDKLSEYIVVLRNIFKITALILQQFNQELSSIDRQKYKGIDLSPQQSDFKDSRNTYQDCDVALGIWNPHKMQIAECLEYDIDKSPIGLKHRFRALKIIKNRLSRDDIYIGLLFHPEAGRFAELPPVEEMKTEYYKKISEL